MYKKLLYLFFSICLFSCATTNESNVVTVLTTKDGSNIQKIQSINWTKNKIHPKISWNHHQFQDLFSSIQSITVVEIKSPGKRIKAAVEYATSGFIKTSDFAKSSEALVAINGSFFDTKNGGSIVFFKKNGLIINQTKEGFTPTRESVGFSINKSESMEIIKKPINGWAGATEKTILSSGPLLRYHDVNASQEKTKFNTNRHPRTAIGRTQDGRILAVVVDGRSSQGQGVSIKELAQLMHALGCVDAMNLDGGGSSTVWIKNSGIVNFPSDNKMYDHQGERAVVNAIIFKE
ncbi:phosphodiester glycosidase family protein [Aureibaculum sp. A20]|uniref:Phosphodiester glycosidase family protein n=1 Tax=Aureibaculum flavum TaxID=2795986 RepID=A0ABS0WTB7_9FLAO|nr:phosphodiester glycosidase family protein [Aureibaculum flavum]MBJ2175204.1 phosphodiester glycosidase family protein [Aureibaculum flavum]